MKSHSLKNTDNTKASHAFFAASLLLFMSVLIIVSGFLNRNTVPVNTPKNTIDFFDRPAKMDGKIRPNSNYALPVTFDFAADKNAPSTEEEKLLNFNKNETAQANLFFGNKSVYELDAFELKIFTLELLADLQEETEPAISIESIDLTIDPLDFEVEANPLLEQLADAKNKELAEFYEHQYMWKEFLQPIPEKELELERWMLDDHLWTAK